MRIYDADQTQLLKGKAQYEFDLPEAYCALDIALTSDGHFSLYLQQGTELHPVYHGTQLSTRFRVRNYDALILRTKQSVLIGGTILVNGNPDTEVLDPTPLARTLAFDTPQTIDAQVRRAVARTLEAMGMSGDNADELDLTPLHGDFSDEEGDFDDPLVDEFLKDPEHAPEDADDAPTGSDDPDDPENPDDPEDSA